MTELTDIQQAVMNCFPMPSERNLDGVLWESQIVKMLNGNKVRIHTVLNDLEYMGYVKHRHSNGAKDRSFSKIPRHLDNPLSEKILSAENTSILISKEEYIKKLQDDTKQLHDLIDNLEDKYLKTVKELEEKKKELEESKNASNDHIKFLMSRIDELVRDVKFWEKLWEQDSEKN